MAYEQGPDRVCGPSTRATRVQVPGRIRGWPRKIPRLQQGPVGRSVSPVRSDARVDLVQTGCVRRSHALTFGRCMEPAPPATREIHLGNLRNFQESLVAALGEAGVG